MARTKRRWCLLLLQFLSVFTFIVQNSSGAYDEQYLESPEVCSSGSWGTFSNLAKKKLRLNNFKNNTVRVQITRWQELYRSFENFRCKFQVVAPKKHGIMVIIQAMHLRTKKNSYECQDWVKFEQKDGLKTRQICGGLDAQDFSKSPSNLLGPRFFYDPQGEMDVSFFTGDKEDDDDTTPYSLSLIFTAYAECSPSALTKGTVRQCSPLRGNSCIASALTCDGVINCGFFDDDFGSDERDCNVESRNTERLDSRSISIYVFAITSVATLVIVVLFVLIICCCLRKFTKRQAIPGTMSQRSHQEALEFNLDSSGPPSAPPLTLERLTNEKTMENLPPPSYSELFPTSQSDSMKK